MKVIEIIGKLVAGVLVLADTTWGWQGTSIPTAFM